MGKVSQPPAMIVPAGIYVLILAESDHVEVRVLHLAPPPHGLSGDPSHGLVKSGGGQGPFPPDDVLDLVAPYQRRLLQAETG